MNKYTKNLFCGNHRANIVSEFGFKIFENEGSLYRIQIWDLAWKDQNHAISNSFIKSALGVIIMSSASNIQTRNDSIKWKENVDEIVIYPDGKELPCILVENNIDLLPNNEYNDPFLKTFGKRMVLIKDL